MTLLFMFIGSLISPSLLLDFDSKIYHQPQFLLIKSEIHAFSLAEPRSSHLLALLFQWRLSFLHLRSQSHGFELQSNKVLVSTSWPHWLLDHLVSSRQRNLGDSFIGLCFGPDLTIKTSFLSASERLPRSSCFYAQSFTIASFLPLDQSFTILSFFQSRRYKKVALFRPFEIESTSFCFSRHRTTTFNQSFPHIECHRLTQALSSKSLTSFSSSVRSSFKISVISLRLSESIVILSFSLSSQLFR